MNQCLQARPSRPPPRRRLLPQRVRLQLRWRGRPGRRSSCVLEDARSGRASPLLLLLETWRVQQHESDERQHGRRLGAARWRRGTARTLPGSCRSAKAEPRCLCRRRARHCRTAEAAPSAAGAGAVAVHIGGYYEQYHRNMCASLVHVVHYKMMTQLLFHSFSEDLLTHRIPIYLRLSQLKPILRHQLVPDLLTPRHQKILQ